MKPRLLNILAVLYLILFTIIAATWAQDSIPLLHRLISFEWIPHETKNFKCDIDEGNVTLELRRYYPNPFFEQYGRGVYFWPSVMFNWSGNWHGFTSGRLSYRDFDDPEWYTSYELGAPAWFLGLLTLTLPALALIRHLRARRHREFGRFPVLPANPAPPPPAPPRPERGTTIPPRPTPT